MKDLTILSNDPSLTAWGWVVIKNGNIVDFGCIKTEPETKKKRIRKSDDRLRRISEINKVLLDLIEKHGINYILSEAPHGSQNASSAIMIGISLGVIQTVSDCLQISVESYSEDDCKKLIFGRKSVAKSEMVAMMFGKYHITDKMSKYKAEAIADAIAVWHTAKHYSNVLKMIQ